MYQNSTGVLPGVAEFYSAVPANQSPIQGHGQKIIYNSGISQKLKTAVSDAYTRLSSAVPGLPMGLATGGAAALVYGAMNGVSAGVSSGITLAVITTVLGSVPAWMSKSGAKNASQDVQALGQYEQKINNGYAQLGYPPQQQAAMAPGAQRAYA